MLNGILAMDRKGAFDRFLGLMFPVSQESKGDQSPNIIAERVDISYGSKVPDPPLQMHVFPVSRPTRMHFRARKVPFLGRVSELQKLQAFLDSDASFSWWLITGAGGSGKSRLALEVCLRHQENWTVGFLPENSKYNGWSEWKPDRSTLIVADYCSSRSLELQDIVTALSTLDTPGKHHVRLLLIERSTEGDWLKNLLGVGSTRLLVESVRYDDPLQTSPMSDSELWQAITFLFEASELRKLPDEQETLQALFELDPLRRPLFAALAADALIAGRDIRLWDQTALLRDVLEREEDKFWKPAGITERDKNLLCFATLLGGMPVENLALPLLAKANFPTTEALDANRFNAERYQVMTAHPSTEFLAPLKPDVLGEFYALERLLPRDKVDHRRAVTTLSLAWLLETGGVLDFVTRALTDFPEHKAVEVIDFSLGKSSIQTLKQLTQEAAGVDESNWTILLLAAAKTHLIRLYSKRGMLERAYFQFDELCELADESPENETLEKVALSSVPFLCENAAVNAREVLRWVAERWKEKGSNPEHMELLISSTFLIARGLIDDNSLEKALKLVHEAIWLSDTFSPSEYRYGSLARGLRGVIAVLGENDPEIAKNLFVLLAGYRERASGDVKYVCNLALAAFSVLSDLFRASGRKELPNVPELIETARFVIGFPGLEEGIASELEELGSGHDFVSTLSAYVEALDSQSVIPSSVDQSPQVG
jgi:hypothetical protein